MDRTAFRRTLGERALRLPIWFHVAVNLAAGVYTFTVTPSIPGLTTTTGTSAPSSGEILFEVILAPN